MIETLIIGSGFSALCSDLILKNFNTKILNFNKTNYSPSFLFHRKNLNFYKFFSTKGLSSGTINFDIYKNVQLHDHLTEGGNTNLWGGFIDISEVPIELINLFKNHSIKFKQLNLSKNGYKSNNPNIRQLRDSHDKILNSKFFFKNYINGFLHSFKVEKNKIITKIYNVEDKKFIFLETKKIILAISFPQLIDVLLRSELLFGKKTLSLSEYKHKFNLSFNKKITKHDNRDCIIKYDFLRSLKHYLGFQKSLDRIKLPLPIYIDQLFSNKRQSIKLDLDCNSSRISNKNRTINFGNSIHYCNLFIDNININDYLLKISKDIVGVGMPFVDQKKPGPISNDIINDIYNKLK